MSRAPETRQSLLLELVRRGDQAWSDFLEVYEEAIFRFCRSRGLQEADARDATQEVLATVHRRVLEHEQQPLPESFRGWLFQVARNISIDTLQARLRSGGSEAEFALAQVPDANPGPEEHVEQEFEREARQASLDWAARQARSEVQHATWQAFHATAVRGLPPEQVAAELGMSVGGVYTAKCRVVARIRERIGQLSGELAPGQADYFSFD